MPPPLSLLRERHDEGAWSAGVNSDHGGAKPIRMLFDVKEIAARASAKVTPGDVFPVVEPAVGLKCEIQEIGHRVSSSGAGRLGDQGA